MQMDSKIVLTELTNIVAQTKPIVRRFQQLTATELNHKPRANSWSILECVEHLNRYGDFYLPEIEQQMLKAKPGHYPVFKAGWLGNYFANLMNMKKRSMKKLKSPADKNPANSQLNSTTLDRFLKQLEKLEALLQQAATVDLTTTKTAITITRLIRLRLGDTFRFLVYHIERHIAQASRLVTNNN
jgi:hypothetical protein